MSRPLLLAAVLFTSAARASNTPPIEADSPRPEDPRRTFSVWLLPMTYGSLTLGSVAGGMRYLAIPLGMGMRLSNSTAVSLELAGSTSSRDCAGEMEKACGTVKSLRVTAGLAWWPRPNPLGRGLYVQPNVGAMMTRDRRPVRTYGPSRASIEMRTDDGVQATAGVNVGYRLVSRHGAGFVEPMVGLSAGYSWNQRRKAFDFGGQYGGPHGTRLGDRAIWEVNLDFFRLGLTF
ncbi:hypothetical protein LY474_32655 [Myxococcus stipitatus]|uniref:hypothetical protein n=1 Tax=Myxococcus stipitatus TaxID=83455 RepID=UPI001F347E10|nr:hypothetical protein [Myxococcus stipitatus]MCE9672570.1 hypothetical protein [Myxococcus stipitatus]